MERIQNPSPCPFCKRMLEGHHSPEKNQTPSPGNATVCIHCGEFLELDYRIVVDDGNQNYQIELPNGNQLIIQDHFFCRFEYFCHGKII